MTRRPTSRTLPLACALLASALALAPAPAAAQFGEGDGTLSLSARIGYDADTDVNGALVLGGGIRTSIPGVPRLELQAIGDWTHLDRITERQFNIDALVEFRGFSLGGGPAFRNTIWLDSEGRETRTGYSVVAIFGGQAGRSLLGAQLELRYTDVSDFSPTTFVLGVNLPFLRF